MGNISTKNVNKFLNKTTDIDMKNSIDFEYEKSDIISSTDNSNQISHIFDLTEKVLFIFDEDPNEVDDQMILFPHETTSKLDKFTKEYV
tara:strand:- start:218 stop:484 length:267 start_codon:yes stop_codon:yes gene_type:complete